MKKIIKKITALFYTNTSLGIDENTSENDFKKIKLLNIFCNSWILFVLFSFIEDFFKDQLINMSYIIMLFFIASVKILQYYKKHFIASIVCIFNLTIMILLFSNYMYKAELLEYYFLLPPAVSLIYIDNKKINIFVLIICLSGFYFPNLHFKHYPVSVFNNMNPPFLFYGVFIVVSYFKNLNIRNEKILEAKTKELEQLDKFKSQFFTNISHEIRTPLTLIQGQVSELEKYTEKTLPIIAIEKGIKKQINAITNMVDNVLDLAKMQSSQFSLQFKLANVSELVRKQYLDFEPLFDQKNIAFNISENMEDYIAKIDTVFLERAITNILINALKYTDVGMVTINLSEENQEVLIKVSDTGIGIAKANMKNVFNRFYQVNNDINKSGGSGGIGLAFSKEIIELHNGQLLLESTPNKGSTFTIKLALEKKQPRITSTNTIPDAIKKEHILKENAKISGSNFLIVDDNYDMRKHIVSILPNNTCFEASNGLEALKIIEQEAIDFIITDYMMPKLNGYEFVAKLKEHNNKTPIIMLTARTDINTKLDVLKLGIDDYVTKPFDKKELLTRIKNCIKNDTSRNSYNEVHNIELERYSDSFITELKRYIYEKSYDRNLNQDSIAETFNISKSSFYRKIKSHTGLSPNNFIKEIRLQKAREILEKNPTILLKQLALEVGFNNDTYFSKIYTKRFGTRPIKKRD
ncbi:hybrid sensor histidine kinase/response regulator transcription factor [Flavivirga jejuensis]|uniref:histidine kinase n=1 Tax=Flavivirga jejuensis TaxID=870487 RepID=A0ABT8WRR9_9FLAO|nr:response regulator [Flavivirga jejuensis]MDO5975892.1 response regulator [Flavivirga jejuensis]